MGFFTGLLTLPLAPVRGVVWVADQLMEVAEGDVTLAAADIDLVRLDLRILVASIDKALGT
jgi:hypothetical protein